MKRVLLLIATTAMLAACNKDEPLVEVPVSMNLQHLAGSNALALGTLVTTPLGEAVTFNIFKYYLSNFSVIYANGAEHKISDTYFLVDEANASSKAFKFNVPEGQVKEIRFWVGVDSARNVSGVQTGALDPANGMFWTWNSGYIFAKLEGRSPVSPAPLTAVTYHIGGFRTGQNALRQISISLPTNLTVNNSSLYTITLTADVMKWFRSKTDISIATEPFTMEPGSLAMKVADNYAQMFVLKEVKKN
jgi:hypothetical protein